MSWAGSQELARLSERFTDSVLESHARLDECTVRVRREGLVDLLRFLRDGEGLDFAMLSDLTALDQLEAGPRLELIYHLYSPNRQQRIRIRVPVPAEDCRVDSVVALWPAADWLEREVWDLHGVRFDGHPDPRRLLLDESFEGHPLRRDHPGARSQGSG